MQTEASILQQRFFLLPLTIGKQDGETLYCLFTQNQVIEVLGSRPIYPVPFSDQYLDGFILRHGGAVPVIDMDVLCGGARKGHAVQPHQLLVVRSGQTDADSGEYLNLAFACTGNVLTFKLTERDVAQVQDGEEVPVKMADLDLFRGCFRLRGYRVVLFDFDRVALGIAHSADDAETKEKPFVW